MRSFIIMLGALFLIYLVIESLRVRQSRQTIEHIIHVNGTRGKSTVTRLIDAGLRAGGLHVYCKTTGTDPMTIDVNGIEAPVVRHGPANIREQISILCRAAKQQAQVLVIECMAVHPELQYAAQHQILKADIGVLTNVRIDHTDVMGESLEEIALALSNTIPKRGTLFTAENRVQHILFQKADLLHTKAYQILPSGSEPDFDFAENIALALAVCQHLGVDRNVALQGMRKYYRDPYALTVHEIKGCCWINGLSINDMESICMVYDSLCNRFSWRSNPLVLLINNRSDRGSRTVDMLRVCLQLEPAQVWLMGANAGFMYAKLKKKLPHSTIRHIKHVDEFYQLHLSAHTVVYAIGNIAQGGREITTWIRKEGIQIVP